MKKFIFTSLILIGCFITINAQNVTISGNKFMVSDQQIWFNGVNTPWQNWDDFGGGFTPSWWRTEFRDYVNSKINLARVWIHCDGANSPTTNDNGSVTGATALFWKNMDSLVAISRSEKVYIMPCLWSFDMVKNSHAGYQKYRNLINSQANIQTYIDNFLIPLVKRYDNEPYIMSWEICNEPEWMFENAEDGPIPIANVQLLHAMCAAAIHKNSTKLVTTGSAAVKWNSDLYQGSGDNAGNVWSDTALHKVYNDPQAKLDFWSFHWYSWVTQWFSSPYQKTISYYKLDDRPVLIGETGGAQCDAFICMNATQYYENSFLNGYAGLCSWKQTQGVPSWISDATIAFYNNHSHLIYPMEPPIAVKGINLSQDTITIYGYGYTDTLIAIFSPIDAANRSITWTSENTNIATVNSAGVVTSVTAGTTRIKANTADGGYSDSCVVVVHEPIAVNNVIISPTSASLSRKETITLKATITPNNATNKNIVWTSSNTKIATITQTGVVKAVSPGIDTITVTTSDGAKKAISIITVIPYADLNNTASSEKISVYPNPVRDHVTIDFKDGAYISDLLLFNCAGMLIKSIAMGGKSYSLDMSNYSNGMYYIVINSFDTILRAMVIKE